MATSGVPVQQGDAAWLALLRHREIQFAFPDAPAISPVPQWLRALLNFLHNHARLFEIGGWSLLAAAGLALGYFLVRHLLRRGWAQADNYPVRPMPA